MTLVLESLSRKGTMHPQEKRDKGSATFIHSPQCKRCWKSLCQRYQINCLRTQNTEIKLEQPGYSDKEKQFIKNDTQPIRFNVGIISMCQVAHYSCSADFKTWEDKFKRASWAHTMYHITIDSIRCSMLYNLILMQTICGRHCNFNGSALLFNHHCSC